MSELIRPFRAAVPDADLADLGERLRNTRWPEPATVSDWSQGVPLTYLQEVCRYWEEEYDWRAFEAHLNSFPQYLTEIDGVDIHFLHVRSPEPDALPVILTHGWPGSIAEFTDVIGPLTDPVAHGGDASEAISLVVPSLPGFGFSGKPTGTGWNREHIADAWAELMDRLDYDRYGTQGGDWGASVSTRIASRFPEHVAGVHLNLLIVGPAPGQVEFSPDELAYIEKSKRAQEEHGRWQEGYRAQQSTRPQTLGYGLTDSPAGQCAWILEKFHDWADCDGDPVAAFGMDRLLDNIALYWLTATGTSSARIYWEAPPGAPSPQVDVPAGTSIFPKELGHPFRPWAERVYPELCYWNELDKGGHFAAFEQPELFIKELRSFFKLVR